MTNYKLEDCAIAYAWLQSDECRKQFTAPFGSHEDGVTVRMPVLLLEGMKHHGYLIQVGHECIPNPDVLANPELTPADPAKGDPPELMELDSLEGEFMGRVMDAVNNYLRAVEKWKDRVGMDPLSQGARVDALKEFAAQAVDDTAEERWGVAD